MSSNKEKRKYFDIESFFYLLKPKIVDECYVVFTWTKRLSEWNVSKVFKTREDYITWAKKEFMEEKLNILEEINKKEKDFFDKIEKM